MNPIAIDREVTYRFFANHPLFKHAVANQQAFAELIDTVSLQRCLKSEYLYKHKEGSTCVYVVQDGEIHIVQPVQETNEKKLLGIQRRGSLFGEVSFLSGQPHTADALAFLDSNVFVVPGPFFIKLLHARSAIAPHLVRLLSARLSQNLTESVYEEPSRLFALFYPEMPERASHLCVRLAQTLTGETLGSVLLIGLNKHSTLYGQHSKIFLSRLLENPERVQAASLQDTRHPSGFSILMGTDIYQADMNLSAMARQLPGLLGYLRKYYDRILVDGGGYAENPVLSCFLSQCDNLVLVRNANCDSNSSQAQEWRKIILYATDHIENFLERVVIVADDCTARGGSAASQINTQSALYKFYLKLHTTTAVPLFENQEKQFLRGLHRLARKLSGTSRGLALGGGGARGLAHIGVFDVLVQEGIDFDGIAGASLGAIVAAMYAMGKEPATMIQVLKNVLPNTRAILDKNLPLVSFFKGRKLNRNILKIFSRVRFEDLEIVFYCNASDLISGQTIVFEKGYLATALRASVSLPVVFPPLDLGSYKLVDGGLLNNMPGNVLRDKGFRKVIGINVSDTENYRPLSMNIRDRRGNLWKQVKDYFSLPPILNIAGRSFEIQGAALQRFREADFDYILYPQLERFGMFDFAQAERIIASGRKAAIESLEQIKTALK